MPIMFWIWLGVIVAATVIELLTWNLTSIWFAFAALVAFILSIFPSIPWEVQVIVFVVLSVGLILSLRKVSLKLLYKHTDGKTNTAELIGEKVKLLKGISEDELGEVKIHGVIWNAQAETDINIDAGEFVEIVKVQGNKMIIKKINE